MDTDKSNLQNNEDMHTPKSCVNSTEIKILKVVYKGPGNNDNVIPVETITIKNPSIIIKDSADPKLVTGVSSPNRLKELSSTSKSQLASSTSSSQPIEQNSQHSRNVQRSHFLNDMKMVDTLNFPPNHSTPRAKELNGNSEDLSSVNVSSDMPNFRMVTQTNANVNVPNLKLVTDGLHESKFVYDTETLKRDHPEKHVTVDQFLDIDESLFEPLKESVVRELGDPKSIEKHEDNDEHVLNKLDNFSVARVSTPVNTQGETENFSEIKSDSPKFSAPLHNFSTANISVENGLNSIDLFDLYQKQPLKNDDALAQTPEFEQLMFEEPDLIFKVHVATHNYIDLDMLSLLSEDDVDGSTCGTPRSTGSLQNSGCFSDISLDQIENDGLINISGAAVETILMDQDSKENLNPITSVSNRSINDDTSKPEINYNLSATNLEGLLENKLSIDTKTTSNICLEEVNAMPKSTSPEELEASISLYKQSRLAEGNSTFHSNTSLYSDEGVHVSGYLTSRYSS